MGPQAPAKNPGTAPAIDPEALKNLWRYNLTNHQPTPEGVRRIEALRSAAQAMADAIIGLCPPGRDQAMALSANEEMLFHANAAVARAMNQSVEDTASEDSAAPDGESTNTAEADGKEAAAPEADAAPTPPADDQAAPASPADGEATPTTDAEAASNDQPSTDSAPTNGDSQESPNQ